MFGKGCCIHGGMVFLMQSHFTSDPRVRFHPYDFLVIHLMDLSSVWGFWPRGMCHLTLKLRYPASCNVERKRTLTVRSHILQGLCPEFWWKCGPTPRFHLHPGKRMFLDFFIPDRNSSVVGLGFQNQIDKPISFLWHLMFSCLTFVRSKPAVAIVLESRN